MRQCSHACRIVAAFKLLQFAAPGKRNLHHGLLSGGDVQLEVQVSHNLVSLKATWQKLEFNTVGNENVQGWDP